MNPPDDVTEEFRIYNAICADDLNFFERGGFTELNLAIAYETVKLRNIRISDNVRLAIEDFLLNCRFLEAKNASSEITIKERIDVVSKQIFDLNQVDIEELNQVTISERNKLDMTKDESLFIYTLTSIAKNINVIKRVEKIKPQNVLIWELIEFYLDYYIYALRNPRKSGICILLLDRRKLLSFLGELAKAINCEHEFEQSFKDDVCETVGLIRNVVSIEKIIKYMKMALSECYGENHKVRKLLVERAIQVLGENLKDFENSPESAHINDCLVQCLFRTWPGNIRETVIIPLRNLLSHSEYLSTKLLLRENDFECLRKDLEKIIMAIKYVSVEAQHDVLKQVISNVSSDTNVKHVKQWIGVYSFQTFETVVKNVLDDTESKICSLMSSVNIEDTDIVFIFLKLVTNETKKANDSLQKLKYDIEYIKSSAGRNSFGSTEFKAFQKNTYNNKETFFQTFFHIFKFLKYMERSSTVTVNTDTESCENSLDLLNYQNIPALRIFREQVEAIFKKDLKAQYFIKCLQSEIGEDVNFNFNKIKNNFKKLIVYDLRYVDLLPDLFTEKNVDESLFKRCERILNQKDTEITNTVNSNADLIAELFPEIMDVDIRKGYKTFKERKVAKFALEYILMDMLVVWKRNKDLLSNQSYLDRPAPTLLGLALRNYLAHGDCLIDSFKGYSRMELYINARYMYMVVKKRHVTNYDKPPHLSLACCNKIFYQFKINIVHQHDYLDSSQNGSIEINGKFGSDFLKQNVLHYAAKGDRDNIFMKIFEDTTNISYLEEEDSFRKTVFESAIKSSSLNVVRLFMNESLPLNQNIRNRIQYKSLNFAISNGKKDIIMEILNKYPTYFREILQETEQLNSGSGKWNVIHVSAKNGSVSITEELVKCAKKNGIDFDVNGRDDNWLSPLHVASSMGHLEMVKYLISLGADIEQLDENAYTSLYLALRHRQNSVIKYLLSKNANIAVNTEDRKTALHLSAQFCDLDISQTIIQKVKQNESLCLSCYINREDSRYSNALDVAVEYHKEETVNLLIKNGASINCSSENYRVPPLHLAARHGNLNVFKILLKEKADILATDVNESSTVLHEAARKGHLEIMDHVESLFVLQHRYPRQKITPAFSIAHHGKIDKTIDLVEKHGRQIQNIIQRIKIKNIKIDDFIVTRKELLSSRNEPDQNSHWAESKNLILENVTKQKCYLHNSRCNEDTYEKVGETINELIMAQKETEKEIRALNDVENLSRTFSNDDLTFRTLIHEDADRLKKIMSLIDKRFRLFENIVNIGDVPEISLCVVRALSNTKNDGQAIKEIMYIFDVLQRISVNEFLSVPDSYGRTAFHLAVENGHIDMVKKMYNSNETIVDKADDIGYTPFLLAAESGHHHIFTFILKTGKANVKSQLHISQRNALHIASSGGHLDIVRDILKNTKIDIDSSDLKGNTALINAVEEGHKSIVDLLLEKNASVEKANFESCTPLKVAIQYNYIEIFETILSHKNTEQNIWNQPSLIHLAVSEGRDEMVRSLLLEGTDLNCIDDGESNGDTPLHVASRKGNSRMVDLLLREGANVDQSNAKGETALHISSRINPEIVQILLKYGANVNSQNEVCQSTPLHLAMENKRADVVDILLQQGADINLTNNFITR